MEQWLVLKEDLASSYGSCKSQQDYCVSIQMANDKQVWRWSISSKWIYYRKVSWNIRLGYGLCIIQHLIINRNKNEPSLIPFGRWRNTKTQ